MHYHFIPGKKISGRDSKARLLFCFSDSPLKQSMFCVGLPWEQASHNQMCYPLFCGPEHRKDNLILNHLQTAKNSCQFDPFYPWLLASPMKKDKYKRKIRSHKFI